MPPKATGADESPHLTLKQLCARWQLKEQTLYNRRRKGNLPPAFKVGKELRFPLAGVEEFEAAGLAADLAPSHEQRPPEPKLPPRGQQTPPEPKAA